jgi:hypothetical protein
MFSRLTHSIQRKAKIIFEYNSAEETICYYPKEKTLIPLYLSSKILPYIANQHGYYLLHASCVSINGQAVAFCAPHGAGKSTVASSLCNIDGIEIISDDILPVFRCDGEYKVFRSSSNIKMWKPINNETDFNLYPNITGSIPKKVIALETSETLEFTLKRIYFVKRSNSLVENIFTPIRKNILLDLLVYQYYETGYNLLKQNNLKNDQFMIELSQCIPCYLSLVDEPLDRMASWNKRFLKHFA